MTSEERPRKRRPSAKAEAAREGYRRLAQQLRFDLEACTAGHCVALLTPRSARTCAEACVQLACFMADEYDSRVLLVDATTARPDAAEILHLRPHAGLLDLAEGATPDLDAALVDTGHAGVALLHVDADADGAAAALHGRALADVIDTARERFDCVLLHGGPVLADSAILSLAAKADRVLLVAVDGETKQDDLAAAHHLIESARAKQVSVVLARPARRRWLPWKR